MRAFGAGEDRPRRLREIVGAPRRDHAGRGTRVTQIDPEDTGVSVRASHDAEMKKTLAGEVVQIPAGTFEKASVFLASRRAPDRSGDVVHAGQCTRPLAPREAASSHALAV